MPLDVVPRCLELVCASPGWSTGGQLALSIDVCLIHPVDLDTDLCIGVGARLVPLEPGPESFVEPIGKYPWIGRHLLETDHDERPVEFDACFRELDVVEEEVIHPSRVSSHEERSHGVDRMADQEDGRDPIGHCPFQLRRRM